MIDDSIDYRIIGDFLEANANILEKRIKSKLPKFIAEYIWKKDHKKLTDMVMKLRNSDYILGVEQLGELFTYVYNNFDDQSYKSITKVKVVTSGINGRTNMEAAINKDNYLIAIIRFNDNESILEFIGQYIKEEGNEKVNVSLGKLYSDNPTYSHILSEVNKELREVMCDYILDIITRYKEE